MKNQLTQCLFDHDHEDERSIEITIDFDRLAIRVARETDYDPDYLPKGYDRSKYKKRSSTSARSFKTLQALNDFYGDLIKKSLADCYSNEKGSGKLAEVLLDLPALRGGCSPEHRKLAKLLTQIRAKRLKKVNLRGLLSNTGLPDELWSFTWIEELSLACNDLKGLPAGIGKLRKLKRLNAKTNNLTSFPRGILSLSGLTELELRFNPIRAVPREIAKLKRLQVLDLEETGIKDLPREIGKLTALRELRLNDNPLRSLPQEMGQLKNLEFLGLAGTRVRSLPGTMEGLENYEDLKP